MAKQEKTAEAIAASRIEHGAMEGGKPVTKVFAPGDALTGLDEATVEALIKCGAAHRVSADKPKR